MTTPAEEAETPSTLDYVFPPSMFSVNVPFVKSGTPESSQKMFLHVWGPPLVPGSRVYRAAMEGSKEKYVCKIYKPEYSQPIMHRFDQTIPVIGSPKARENSLTRLVGVLVSKRSGNFYMFCERLDRGSLKDIMAKHEFTEYEVSRVVLDLVKALRYLRDNGIFHMSLALDHILAYKDSKKKQYRYFLGGLEYCWLVSELHCEDVKDYAFVNMSFRSHAQFCSLALTSDGPQRPEGAYPAKIAKICLELLRKTSIGNCDDTDLPDILAVFDVHKYIPLASPYLRDFLEACLKKTPMKLEDIETADFCTHANHSLQVLTKFENFRPKQKLGEGGFCKVKLFYDTISKKYCVIKKALSDKDRYDELWQEANLLKRLNEKVKCSNGPKMDSLVVQTVKEFVYKGKVHVVMEYMGAKSLSQFVENMRQLTHKEMDKVVWNVFSFIYYLNKLDVVYNDMKPDNLLLNFTREFQVKVGDFNSCIDCKKPPILGHGGSPPGTKGYSAPEMMGLNGDNEMLKKYCEKKVADVWSLGMIMLYMALQGEENKKIRKGLATYEFYKKASDKEEIERRTSPYAPNAEYVELMLSCLEVDPFKRPSISEVHRSGYVQSLDKKFRSHLL